MTFLLDVNLLMALLWENHEHHQTARAWLRRVTDFTTCPVSQLGFARVSSHALLGYSMSPDQAVDVLRRFLSDSRPRFVPDDLSCEDRLVRTLLRQVKNSQRLAFVCRSRGDFQSNRRSQCSLPSVKRYKLDGTQRLRRSHMKNVQTACSDSCGVAFAEARGDAKNHRPIHWLLHQSSAP